MKKKILIIGSAIVGLYLIIDFGYYFAYRQSVAAYEECAEVSGITADVGEPKCWHRDGREVRQLGRPNGLASRLLE